MGTHASETPVRTLFVAALFWAGVGLSERGRSMRKGGTCRRLLLATRFSGKLLSLRGPLAQPGRALASHARGHWFKSSTVHCPPGVCECLFEGIY